MFSWNVTGTYAILPNTRVGLGATVTDGYKDRTEEVSIEGIDASLFVSHRVATGPLKGLNAMVILNKAEEYYKGDGVSDRLDFYDIKFKASYDIAIF
jgi:putative glucuronide porin